MAKKDPYRFCLKFNENDPSHKEVADILNGEGRKAAQFVANAIMHYINCENTGKINVDQNKLLLMQIADTVRETLESSLKGVKLKEVSQPVQTKKIRHSAEISADSVEINPDDTNSIMDSFNSFLK